MKFNEGDKVWVRIKNSNSECNRKGTVIGISYEGRNPARYFVDISASDRQHIIEARPDELKKWEGRV